MKHGTQSIIAGRLGISQGYLSEILAGKKRPRAKKAENLSLKVDGFIAPSDWIYLPATDLDAKLTAWHKQSESAQISP